MNLNAGYPVILMMFELMICASMIACDTAGEEPPTWDEARIQPRGVDGIELGMTFSDVEEKLGEADTRGWASSRGREYEVLAYHRGDYKGLYFHFPNVSGVPISNSPVHSIYIRQGYDGFNKNSIGIGSARHDVEKEMGHPDLARGDAYKDYVYCSKYGVVTFHFPPNDIGRVSSILIEHKDFIKLNSEGKTVYGNFSCQEW